LSAGASEERPRARLLKGVHAISFISFPLRLHGSFLRKTDEPEAVLRLIEMMARTPGGSWKGCRHFGVRDLFEGMRLRPDGIKQAEQAINNALKDLGITHFRLESIRREQGPNADVDVYSVTLVSTVDPDRKYTSSLARPD